MPRKDIYKDGVKTQFSSTNRPKNPGRRPNVFEKYIKENRVSRDDIRALIESIPQYDANEVDQLLNTGKKDKDGKNIVRKDVPILLTLMLKAFTSDMAKGELTNTEKLWDRAYGKPEKTVNHEIGAISTETLAKLGAAFAENPTKTNEKKTRTKRN